MIAKNCIHPIKVNRIITEFLNSLCDLPSNTHFVVKSSNSNDMNSFISIDDFEIIVPRWRTVEYKNDIGGKMFRKDFVKRCPMAKGFADVTLALLHEVGHQMTVKDIPTDYRRSVALRKIAINTSDPYKRCMKYFSLIDELLATNWAINWLKNAENRKLAKQFEKQFFACFTTLM